MPLLRTHGRPRRRLPRSQGGRRRPAAPGVRVLLVHAKDSVAADFYRRHGFALPIDHVSLIGHDFAHVLAGYEPTPDAAQVAV